MATLRRTRAAARPTAGGAALVSSTVALLLAACSSSSPTTAPRRPAVTTTTAPATTTAPTTAPAPSGDGTVACATAQLRGAPSTGAPATAGRTTVVLTSMATAPCILSGYPRLTLLGRRGGPLPTRTVDGGSFPFTALPVTMVTLTPGGTASFNIGSSATPTGGKPCSAGTALAVVPPSNEDRLVVPAAITACPGGTLEVSPVLAGPVGAGGPG